MHRVQGLSHRPDLICFSHLRWDFVYQRPQHLMSLAARSHRVIYIEEPVFEDGVGPSLDVTDRPQGAIVVVPHLPHGLDEAGVEREQNVLIRNLLEGSSASGRLLWYYTPMALGYSQGIAGDVVIYDNMDELTGFIGAPPRLIEREAQLLAEADLVFTGGVSLYEAKRGRHPSVHAFPSSVDASHFAEARGQKTDGPEDQAKIAHPRVGFFGVIDERMNIQLLGEVAALKPDWQFVMIGPVVKIDPGSLPRAPNIHWLGGKSYAELPRYLAGWDAGAMPFALNEATRYISPTKTLEFLAAGVPIVSTAIADVVKPYGVKGLVEIASDAEAFAAALQRVMARPRAPWLAAVDEHLGNLSWERTWQNMQALIEQARRRNVRPEAVAGARGEPANV